MTEGDVDDHQGEAEVIIPRTLIPRGNPIKSVLLV